MYLKITLLLFVISAFIGDSFLIAQPSGHPSYIQWKYLETPLARVIYPAGKSAQASRIASILDKLNQPGISLLAKKPRRIDLVLQTHQVISNGYVGIGPYRSEFYATPPQDLNFTGTTDWLDLLAIHEYRHVQQSNFMNTGLIKVLHYFFGQGGWATGKFLAAPNWFDEGDAVMTETKLSPGGRGRTPEFFARQRAIFNEHGTFKYSKARNGSYKDVVPNHYLLGYSLCNFLENGYGEEIWPKILNRSARFEGIFYPFKKAIKKETGLRFSSVYKTAFAQLDSQLSHQPVLERSTSFSPIKSSISKTPTFYEWPFYHDHKLYALKESFQSTSGIYEITPAKDRLVTAVGISQENFLAENNGYLTWTEYEKHPRWDFENNTVLMFFDIRSGLKKKLSPVDKTKPQAKAKLFSPYPSSDGSQIVAVQFDTSLVPKVVIVDIASNQIQSAFNIIQDASAASYPRWLNDDEIAYIAKRNSEVSIILYHLKNKTHKVLLPWTNHPITHLNIHQNGLIFSAGFSGIDNIYKIDVNGQIEQLTDVITGAYTPVMVGDTLSYSQTIFKGSNLLEGVVNPKSYEIIKQADFVFKENKADNILQDIPPQQFEEKNFSRTDGLQLHSYLLAPSYVNTALSLYYENTLSNLEGITSLNYNNNEKNTTWSASLNYSALLPVFDLFTNTTERNLFLLGPQDSFKLNNFKEYNIGLNMSLPLSWINGNYNTSFTPNIGIQQKILRRLQEEIKPIDLSSFQSMDIGFSFTHRRRLAFQNVRTKLGQDLRMNYRRALGGLKANTLYANASLYLPGVSKNHSIRINGQFRKELAVNDYRYLDQFQYHRGGNNILCDQAMRMSVDYMLPLVYPDFGFFDLIYFRRIRANFFADYARYTLPRRTEIGKSIGLELFFDNRYFNEFPVTSGVRVSHSEDFASTKTSVQFILGLDF